MPGKRLEGRQGEPGGLRRDVRRPRPGEASVTKGAKTTGRFAEAADRVRIIGGRWKRTPLPVPASPGLRPSPDRVRETLFNWLTHQLGDFSPVSGLDLFAGTGALGFELASRGAERVTLVEIEPALVAQLQRTKQKLAADAVTVVRADGLAFAGTAPERSFDIVFLDPPFDAGILAPALRAAARLVAAGGYVYAESDTQVDEEAILVNGLHIVRSGRAGRVHFHLLQRA